MAKYWLDTSVYLHAANDVLAFDLAPEFWEMLAQRAKQGLIGSPAFVYRELVEVSGREDPVCIWAKEQKDVLFVEPGEQISGAFTVIADFVNTSCDLAEGDSFLNGADPWVIAHAMAGGTVVVSQEKLVGVGSKRVKVPNVCANFSIPCLKLNQFMRELQKEKG